MFELGPEVTDALPAEYKYPPHEAGCIPKSEYSRFIANAGLTIAFTHSGAKRIGRGFRYQHGRNTGLQLEHQTFSSPR